MKPTGAAGTGELEAPPVVDEVLRSPGRPLGAALRASMEPRFGHDFSRVRIRATRKRRNRRGNSMPAPIP